MIEHVLTHLEREISSATTASHDLPPCVIRDTCRWYSQRGAQACAACSYVITDQSC